MVVTNSEISAGTKNKRTRRVVGLSGGVITFESRELITKGDVVSVNFKDRQQCYKVAEVSAANNTTIEVAAVEYGYYAHFFSRKSDFDVRSLIGLEVSIVTDESTLDKLAKSSCYC